MMQEAAHDGPDSLRIAVFAGLAELAGDRTVELCWRGGTVAELRAALIAALPVVGPLVARSAVAVDGRYVADDATVPVGADVAILPPVSGG